MDDASHGYKAVEIGNGAPGGDAIESACRARANRLFRQSALVVPLNLLGAVWLFYDESLTAVVLWALASAIVIGAGAWVLGWPVERGRVLDGRVASATVQTIANRRVGVVLGSAPARRERDEHRRRHAHDRAAVPGRQRRPERGDECTGRALLPRLGRRQLGPAALLAPVPRDRPSAARSGRGRLRRVVVGLPPGCERCRRAVGNARSAHGCVDGRNRRRP